MKMQHLFFSIFVLVINILGAELIDLEKDYLSPFVLDTKKIQIPGFPDAFNPSIIRWNSSLLISFRSGDYRLASDDTSLLMSFRIRDPITFSTNQIGLVLLDENLNLISNPQILEIPLYDSTILCHQQDPRLINVQDRIFIVFSNFVPAIEIPQTRRMLLSELKHDGKKFKATYPEAIIDFEGENEKRWEKNWVPFEYNGDLLLAYSLVPHRILRPLLGTSSAETFCSSICHIKWDWGILRGGTQAFRDGDHYLSFFHSSREVPTLQSNGKKMSHYVMGAYTFESEPPFNITHISPEPIVGKRFYNGPIHKTWKPLRVIFPGGFIFNEDFVWVAYGRQDHEIWITKMDKKGLLKSLVPVESNYK